MVYNIDLEQYVLGGLINNPNVYPEISTFLEEQDFTDTNRIIFSIIKTSLDNQEEINSSVIVTKLAEIGLSFQDNVDPADYIAAITSRSSNPKSIIEGVKRLKVVTKRREFVEVSNKIKNKMIKSSDMSYDEVVSWVDKEFYDKINSWYDSGDCIDLFETMFDRVEDRIENPTEEIGFKTPYPCFNNEYGGFEPGEVYVFCSRAKQGKSSWLNSTAFEMSNTISQIPCLILDTEMREDQVGDRLLSKISGIPTWHIRTGQCGYNPELAEKLRKAKEIAAKRKYRLFHDFVVNTPIDQVVSKIKRWYYTKVGRGNPCLIIYDYIKLTGESLSEFNKEYQAIGEKVNKLKEVISKDVKAPLLTSCQLNRTGAQKQGDMNDDSTAIAMSDRVLWFASYVGIFRRKTPEEIAEVGSKFGTHSLIHVESRWQGRDAAGHSDFVKTNEGKLVRNFHNYSVENFDVQEVGNAKSMYEQLAAPVNIHKGEQEVDSPL